LANGFATGFFAFGAGAFGTDFVTTGFAAGFAAGFPTGLAGAVVPATGAGGVPRGVPWGTGAEAVFTLDFSFSTAGAGVVGRVLMVFP
jgi:hypothetical protein